MFTGIIETVADVLQRTDTGLMLARPPSFTDLTNGQSIAVSGICLSLTHFDDRSLFFDVVPETWKRTNLRGLKKVNLERSIPASGRFEGHIVQGHIEGVGEVVDMNGSLTIAIPSHLIPFLVSKGSIAFDGVSLTIASLQDDLCTVSLIPLTLTQTTLGERKKGDKINIETDILGRYVHAMIRSSHAPQPNT